MFAFAGRLIVHLNMKKRVVFRAADSVWSKTLRTGKNTSLPLTFQAAGTTYQAKRETCLPLSFCSAAA
jgi:hypothetical protein